MSNTYFLCHRSNIEVVLITSIPQKNTLIDQGSSCQNTHPCTVWAMRNILNYFLPRWDHRHILTRLEKYRNENTWTSNLSWLIKTIWILGPSCRMDIPTIYILLPFFQICLFLWWFVSIEQCAENTQMTIIRVFPNKSSKRFFPI